MADQPYQLRFVGNRDMQRDLWEIVLLTDQGRTPHALEGESYPSKDKAMRACRALNEAWQRGGESVVSQRIDRTIQEPMPT